MGANAADLIPECDNLGCINEPNEKRPYQGKSRYKCHPPHGPRNTTDQVSAAENPERGSHSTRSSGVFVAQPLGADG